MTERTNPSLPIGRRCQITGGILLFVSIPVGLLGIWLAFVGFSGGLSSDVERAPVTNATVLFALAAVGIPIAAGFVGVGLLERRRWARQAAIPLLLAGSLFWILTPLLVPALVILLTDFEREWSQRRAARAS